MGFFWNSNSNEGSEPVSNEVTYKAPVNDIEYMSFGSQFREFGTENLALPIIRDTLTGSGGHVRFGINNDNPQRLNQMYYTSPINGAIVNFKVNAVIGGGFTIKSRKGTAEGVAKAMVFEKKYRIKKLVLPSLRDYVIHESAYFLCKFSEAKKLIKISRIPREQVRNTADKNFYFVSKDWSQQIDIKVLRPYTGVDIQSEMILCFEAYSVGMDTYSLPSYTSAMNWFELDGQMSVFHKNNIKNSIFPSFMITFPKKPSGDAQLKEIKSTIEGAKGVSNVSRVMTFFANNKDQMPVLTSVPINDNSKLFDQSDRQIDSQACKAHCIDPLLMGIRVAGSLGSGNELKQTYTIFEKNTVIPLREVEENMFNTILSIAGVDAEFKVNEYQIINETIVAVEDEQSKVLDALNSIPDIVGVEIIKRMSDAQLLAIVGLKNDKEEAQ